LSKIDIPNYIKTFYNFGADIDGDRLTAEKSTIESALKLQELVKAKLKELQLEDMGGSWVMVREGLLENLIEESEKWK